MPSQVRGLLTLIFVTVVWGTTFALIKDATANLDAAAITFWRFLLASFLLAPFARATPSTWKAGIGLGILMFAGYACQAIGLETTSANRSAFITGLNVVMVPVFLYILTCSRNGGFHQASSTSTLLWLAAIGSTAGIALISAEGGPLQIGDIWTLGSAVAYTIYIIEMGRHAPLHPTLPLAAIQVLIMTIAAAIWSGLESSLVPGFRFFPDSSAWMSLLYLGSVATAGTTILQTLGQRIVAPTQAAIIYALEPVFGAIFSYLWIGEAMGTRGIFGAALVVGAMILSQYAPLLQSPVTSSSKHTQG